MATHSYKENINRVRNANASRPSRLCRFGERSLARRSAFPPISSRCVSASSCSKMGLWERVLISHRHMTKKTSFVYVSIIFHLFHYGAGRRFSCTRRFSGADPPTPRSLCPVGDEVPHSSVCLMVLSSVNKRNSTRNRARPNLGDGKEAIYTL